jgi:hypothetical protein
MGVLKNLFDRGNDDHISPFDAIRHEDEQGEYWWARELGETLGYGEWRKFRPSIERTLENITALGTDQGQLIVLKAKLLNRGDRGGTQTIEDFRLTRRACYLVAINADASKPIVAAAKNYFVVRTRQAELAEEALRKQEPIRVSQTPWFNRIVYQQAAHSIMLSKYANTKFTVFSETWGYLLEAEKIMLLHELPTIGSDLMDGSIAKRFANFFEKQMGFRNVEKNDKVTVEVEGTGIPVNPLLWDLEYLPMFRQWLMDTYFPACFIEYLNRKDSLKPRHEIAKASAADHVSKKFTDTPAKLKDNHRAVLDANGNQPITDTMAKRMAVLPNNQEEQISPPFNNLEKQN